MYNLDHFIKICFIVQNTVLVSVPCTFERDAFPGSVEVSCQHPY